MNARRVNPSRHLYQGAPYTNAASTDIRARFKAIQQEQAKPAPAANVKSIKKARTA